MYHIGKVLNVISAGKDVLSADDSVQVLVEMWDKNILTFVVHPKIAKKIKKSNYVLVDYRPVSEKMPVPRHVVTKILKGKTAEDVWKHYKKFFAEKQKKLPQQQPTILPPQSYMG